MYVSNTHLKPVLGIDIHFVNMPFPFIPLPHPYIGLVIDPFDYIPFIGATVKVNGVPRGNTQTMGIIITFMHIPFGAGFTLFPMIGHDSQNFFGSKKVMVDGSPMSGAGHMVMTCNDIGLPLSFRPGRKFIPIPSLYLPTSYCIPLQWGAPVNVGGPMIPDFNLMTLLKAFAFGSFLKVFGKLGGKMLKKLNSKLSKEGLSGKLKNKLCKMGFEPVDLVTGRVNYEYTDFELPGDIPIKWTRHWDSDTRRQGLTGHGSHLCYDRFIKIMPDDDMLMMSLEDGRPAAFPLLQPGQEFYHPQEKLKLTRKQNGHFLLLDYNSRLYYHFTHEVSLDFYRLSFIENDGGRRIQFDYHNQKLSTITDTAGRRLIITTNHSGLVTQVEVKHQDLQQVLVSYRYNEVGDLTAALDALGQVTSTRYENHLMVEKTDRNGHTFFWDYDRHGRCTHTYGADGRFEGWLQFNKGHTVVTNGEQEQSTYWYDENNLCIQKTDAYDNSRYYRYTENFELYREIDEEGHVTGYTYDDNAMLQEKILPDGSSIQYHYNEQLQPTLTVYPGGESETYGYSTKHLLRFINYPNGQTISYEHNEAGQVTAVIENGMQKSCFAYDEDGNLAKAFLPDGAAAIWEYDAMGRCIRSVNTAGEVRHYEFDALSRVTRLALPDGNQVDLAYNAYQEVTRASDRHSTVSYEYSPLGSITKRKQNGTEINFAYDTQERLCTIVNEAGSQYHFGYNKRGEVVKETGFDHLQRQYQRDATGKILRMVRPGGRFTHYEYDANGRIIRAEFHDGSWEIFRYDKNGLLAEATNENTTVKIARNNTGQIETEWQDDYAVKSSYDEYGNRINIASSLGAGITMQRNEMGRVTHMEAKVDELLWDSQQKYNTAGQLVEKLMPGGVKDERRYDHAGRPAEQRVSANGTLQSWKKYTWDANDRLVQAFDALAQASTGFKHDAVGNLVFAQYADNRIVHRATDDTGNIYETKTRSDRKYNEAGALIESEKYLYKYDEEGNLLSKTEKATHQKTRYEWQGNGMLKSIQQPDGREIVFKYDALGRRTEKSFNKEVTRFIWDGNLPLHEFTYKEQERPVAMVNEWGNISYDRKENTENLTTWLFEADSFVPTAKIADGKKYSIVSDYLGTPQMMLDEDGEKVWEGVLDIYGRLRTLTGEKSALPFRYQGQYDDVETGLCYNRFRYYDTQIGNYISQDPIRLAGGDNFYAYVHNPNAWIDVFGLMPWGEFMNGASATITAGNKTGTYHSSTAGHAEINGLNDFANKGWLNGHDVVISDVTGDFSTGPKPVGVCSKCRSNIFGVLDEGGAKSVTVPVTKGNVTVDQYKINRSDFGRVQAEVDRINAGSGNARSKSDKAWKVLKKYKCN